MEDINNQLEQTFNIPVTQYIAKINQSKGLPADIDSLLRAKEYCANWLMFVREKQNEYYKLRELSEQQYRLEFGDKFLEKREDKGEDGKKPSVDEAKYYAEIMCAKLKGESIEYDTNFRRAKDLGDWLKDHIQDLRQKIAIVRDDLDLQRFQQQQNNE